jgi:HTH-type transcriptional regulator / antitoxin HipB
VSALDDIPDKSTLGDFLDCRRTLTLLQCRRTPTFPGEERMRIRTPTDLGALIRDRRIKLALDQRSLAQKVGVSRQWVVEVEKGKPRAEIGLLLRTIDALGIQLMTEEEASGKKRHTASAVDIDSIVAAARGERK